MPGGDVFTARGIRKRGYLLQVQDLLIGGAMAQSCRSPMRRRVQPISSLALLTLVSLLGGCPDGQGGPHHRAPVVLGFSQIVAKANWNAANTESIRKAARDAGIELR